MDLKTIQPQWAITHTLQTNLQSLMQTVGEIPHQMMEELQKIGLEPCGPQIWIYSGCEGDPNAIFQLEIAIPVAQGNIHTENFSIRCLPEFKCISAFNHGPWNQVGKIYEQLMADAESNKLTPTFVSREIYLVCDFENQENCVTEVLLEIL
jgi:effector-binding domain-containing protein